MLVEALRSVSRQTHLELVLILVRDGGEPLSEAARQELERLEFPYRLIERDDPPRGHAKTRNHGLEEPPADAIPVLDDDDLWD